MNAERWQDDLLSILKKPTIIFAADLPWHELRTIPDHTHDVYQLDYFYRGSGQVRIAGKDYAVRPGDLFLINPNEKHDFRAARVHPMEGITFKFDMRENGQGPLFPPHVGNLGMLSQTQQREIENYLRRACSEANIPQQENQQLAAALLSVFFILLLRYLNDARRLVSPESELSPCGRVREYIKRHYSRQLTLADLARIAGLEPHYLCRTYSREIGTPPIADLARERMAAAKQLLAYTRLPITEVGLRVGYQDTYHFSKRFKEIAGVSPKRYRQMTHTV